MKSKEASWKACEILLKLGLRGNLSNSVNMNRLSCHVWKFVISFSNLNLVIFELFTTHYQTLQTRIGLNVTRYHSLIMLLHALQHTLPYIFSEICVVLGNWKRVTTRYRYFFKKDIDIFFYKFDGNGWKIAPRTC